VPLDELVDVESEYARLSKEREEVDAQVSRLEGLLSGPFSERAPAEIVDKEKEKLRVMKEAAVKLASQLDALKRSK
jgi:valyl-tRNA synthetase